MNRTPISARRATARRALSLLAAPLLCGALLSAGSAAAEEKQISIAFVSGPLNDSFFPPLYTGAQDAAKALGVKLNYIPIDEADIESHAHARALAHVAGVMEWLQRAAG